MKTLAPKGQHRRWLYKVTTGGNTYVVKTHDYKRLKADLDASPHKRATVTPLRIEEKTGGAVFSPTQLFQYLENRSQINAGLYD